MKKFRCEFFTLAVGWIAFIGDFKNKKEAIDYCKSKTEFSDTVTVEEVEE